MQVRKVQPTGGPIRNMDVCNDLTVYWEGHSEQDQPWGGVGETVT
jgi:hypothetical protein